MLLQMHVWCRFQVLRVFEVQVLCVSQFVRTCTRCTYSVLFCMPILCPCMLSRRTKGHTKWQRGAFPTGLDGGHLFVLALPQSSCMKWVAFHKLLSGIAFCRFKPLLSTHVTIVTV